MEVSAKTLHQALVRVGKAVPTRSMLPILTHIKIGLGVDYLTIEGTDLDVGIKVRVPVENPSTFTAWECCAPWKLMTQAVKVMSGDVNIDYVESDEPGTPSAMLKVNGSTFPTMDACDWPTLPVPEKTVFQAEISKEQFVSSLSGSYAASRDKARYNINCIRLEPGLAIATNGHRLSARTADWYQGPAVNVPIAIESVLKIMPDQLTVQIEEKNLFLTGEGFRTSVRLIEGDYPDWRKAIPDTDSEVRVHRGELLRAIKALTPYFDDGKRPNRFVTLTLDEESPTLRLDMSHPDRGSGSEIARLGYTEVGQGELGLLNLMYLQDVVHSCPEEWIPIRFKHEDYGPLSIGETYNLVMPGHHPDKKDDKRNLERLPEAATFPWLNESAAVARKEVGNGKSAGKGKNSVKAPQNAPQAKSAVMAIPSVSPEVEAPNISDLESGKAWGLRLCRWLRKNGVWTDKDGNKHKGVRSLALSHRFWKCAQRNPSRSLFYAGAAYGFLQGR